VAIAFEDGGARGAGVARYIRSAEQPDTAEAAVTVLDAYQGRGIGTVLLEVLTLAALERGITRFTGTVLRDNARMLTVLRSAGAHLNFGEPGVLAFTIDLPDRAVALERTPLYRVLRAAAEGQTQVDQEEPSER
jgi:GNAT superfamily N-acetyltransferase